MKLRSVMLAGGAAVLLPLGGFMLTQSALHVAAMAQSPGAVDQNEPKPGQIKRHKFRRFASSKELLLKVFANK
jgi:hypothetical protein